MRGIFLYNRIMPVESLVPLGSAYWHPTRIMETFVQKTEIMLVESLESASH